MNSESNSAAVRDTVPKPGTPDLLESHAAEIAKRHHHDRVTEEDRMQAYEELKKLSQDQSENGEVSH